MSKESVLCNKDAVISKEVILYIVVRAQLCIKSYTVLFSMDILIPKYFTIIIYSTGN